MRAGDKRQIEKIVNHARTPGILKLAVLHQDIPMGTGGVKVVADEAARLTGMDVKGYQSVFKPEEQTKAAEEVFKSNPQGVIAIGAPPFTAGSVGALRKAGATQSIFILGDTAPGMLAKVAGADLVVSALPRSTRTPMGDLDPGARVPGGHAGGPPRHQELRGFSSGGLSVGAHPGEGMRRIRGEITPAALAKRLQAMGEVDFDGYCIDFSKGNTDSRFVDIAVMDQEGRSRWVLFFSVDVSG